MKTRRVVTLVGVCLVTGMLSVPVQAVLYPGFEEDFHVYTNDLPLQEDYSGLMVIKFLNGSEVELSAEPGRWFTSPMPENTNALNEINEILTFSGCTGAVRAFTRPVDELAAEHEQAEMRVGEALPDLNLFFMLHMPTYGTAVPALLPLYDNSLCEIVYLHPKPVELPVTSNYMGLQGYLGACGSHNGYDAQYAWSQPGGDGGAVRLVDIEYDWFLWHEDLQRTGADLLGGVPSNLFGTSRNHGTASVGVSAALSNGYGMQGIVYNIDLKVVSALDGLANWVLHNAVNLAVSNTVPGDVILLEQQAQANGAFCPIEYWALFYAAIVNATALDRIVIEPAGNGGTDLDGAVWGGLFSRAWRDSLTIMVGAGTAATNARASFSNYGSRLDIQGWGDWSVASLGYGDVYGTHLSNEYTATFSGTSSASALSAGIAASVQSHAQVKYAMYLPPQVMRATLVSNGVPQTYPPAGTIGPRPCLSNAYAAVVPEPFGSLAAVFVLLCTARRSKR